MKLVIYPNITNKLVTYHNKTNEISDISWYIYPRTRRDVSLTYHLYILITIFNNLVLGGTEKKCLL